MKSTSFVMVAVLALGLVPLAAGVRPRAEIGKPAHVLAGRSVVAQPQQSVAEARALELAHVLRVGRRGALEAFIRRSYDSKVLGGAPMAMHLNYYHRSFYLAQGAERIGTRNVTPYSASVYWYSPLLEDWYGITNLQVDSVAPHGILGQPQGPPPVVRVAPPENVQGPTLAKSPHAAWRSLDAWVNRLAGADRFSGVVLVARGSQVIGVNGYGEAAREFGVRNTPATRMILGSIPKMFTAVSILQLVEQGTISLDDPLAKYLPGVIPAPGETDIRIKHLLTHTSGLGDFLWRPQMMAANSLQRRGAARIAGPGPRDAGTVTTRRGMHWPGLGPSMHLMAVGKYSPLRRSC